MNHIRMFALLLTLLPHFAFAAAATQESQIDAIFAGLNSDKAPGAAVLVLKDGRVVFERGYGVTDLGTLRKIDSHTNFRLASLTKQFTAMAVMLLIHDGKLSYDTRITDIFPKFGAYGKAITVRNLLNHTSGLKDYEDLMKPQSDMAEDKLVQIKDRGVWELLRLQKAGKFEPGARWDYSNSGYALLAIMVQRVSGKPFGQFLHDRIFAPLNMDTTLAYEKGKNWVPNRAYGHSQKEVTWQQHDQSPTSAVLGDGGVYSSLDDLTKWDAALRDHTLLSAAEMQPALTPVKVAQGSVQGPNGQPAEYGFGWFLDPYKGHPRMWHYGETVGFRTNIQRFENDGLTIIVLCNRDDVNPGDMALRVADLFLTKPER